MMKAGEGIEFFEKDQNLPEGAKVISVQTMERSDGLEIVQGYWYKVPVPVKDPFLNTALKYLKYAVQKADIDDNGAWKERVLDFLRETR